jgi:hypothetical protein
MHVCVCVRARVCVRALRVCVYACMSERVYVCMCVRARVCTRASCMRVCVYACMCVCVHIWMCIYTYGCVVCLRACILAHCVYVTLLIYGTYKNNHAMFPFSQASVRIANHSRKIEGTARQNSGFSEAFYLEF